MRDVKFYDKQVYDPSLTCHVHTDECTKDVTEYYFSDGGTLPLCTFHAATAPVIGDDDGTLMSKQYYNEVYNKE